MQRRHFRESPVVSASLLVAVALALGACSSSGNSGNSTPSAPPPSTSTPPTTPASSPPATGSAEPTSGPGAVAAIKANWATFFSAKTPLSRRVALLQNGQALSGVIKSQLSGSGFASQVTSKVSAVTLTGTNQASVIYSIYLAGQPALAGSHGVSVYQDGVWKVGLVSLCGLLKLENAGKTSGLPAACQG
jgi:hypothetical protein